MVNPFWQRIKQVDWLVFAAIFFLVAMGLIIIYGISINPVTPDISLFRKQLVYVLVGFLVFFMLSNVNYRAWSVYSKVIYLFFFLLLLGVLFFGTTIRGTKGWISLGFMTLQPVEFAKIGLIIFLAKYFSDHGRHFFFWFYIIVSGVATGAYIALVLKQPDLGSAMVLLGTWFLMLLIIGVPRRHLMILVGGFLIVCVVAWALILKPYQKDRIMTFLNPQANTLGVGYNVRQSVISVGSGQVFGRGFGLGSQSQLKFLPAAETDFIFAVLAEEFGFLGVIFLFTGLLILIIRLIVIARQTSDNFVVFFCLGLASLLTVQIFINIGMNMGIAPVTGIPLPFISSGGSSLLSLFIAFGVISSVVADNRTLHAGNVV